MKKKGIIIVSVLSVLLIGIVLFLTVFLVNPYFTYINTHTWATVTAKAELQDENGDFELTQEYLKGDTITVGDVMVVITDISTNGTVDLKVQSGNLYDSNSEPVKKFTITLDKQECLLTDDGEVAFMVISNRYQ